MSSIRVPAFAKVNLRLDVLGKRPDGYHELRTIFQSLTLARHARTGAHPRFGNRAALERRRGAGRGAFAAKSGVARAERAAAGARAREEACASKLQQAHSCRAWTGRWLERCRGRAGGVAAFERTAHFAGAAARDCRWTGRRRAVFSARRPRAGVSRGDEIYPLPDAPRRSVLVVSPQGISVSTPEAYEWLDGVTSD